MGLLGRNPPLTEEEKELLLKRLAALPPREEVVLSTPRAQEPTGRAYRFKGDAKDVRKAQMDARYKSNLAKLRSGRPAKDDASGLNVRNPDKRRLRKNISASVQQANTDYEFSVLENERRRLDYLRKAKEDAGENYTGPPIIDFSEVTKQGLRGHRPLPQHIGLESGLLGVYNPLNRYRESMPDAIHVDPGKHTSSVVPFTYGAGDTPRKHLSVGDLERTREGRPIIETETHEIAHRVARDMLADPLFKEVHAAANKERAHTRDGKLLPFMYKDGDAYSLIEGGYKGGKTPKRNPHLKRDDNYSREHQMIRAATEGSDPTTTAKERNFSKSKHTDQAIEDAKQFNELVGLYAAARRKIEIQEDVERRRKELELAREDRENQFEKYGWSGYQRLQEYKKAMEEKRKRVTIPPPQDMVNKSGLL